MSKRTNDLMKQLRFISAASNAFMSQRKQKFSGQQRVLVILGKEDGLIQSQLAEILDLRPSSLAELLKKMEKNGEITRVATEEDKRLKRVYLTEKGRQKVPETGGTKAELSEAFFAGLTEAEKQQFSEYLQKIADGWEANFKKQSERFVDPTDRLQAMQEMRQSLVEQYGDDWHNLSPDETRKLRREMHRGPFFGGREEQRDARNRQREFHRDFWGRAPFGEPRSFHQTESENEENNEWEDF